MQYIALAALYRSANISQHGGVKGPGVSKVYLSWYSIFYIFLNVIFSSFSFVIESAK